MKKTADPSGLTTGWSGSSWKPGASGVIESSARSMRTRSRRYGESAVDSRNRIAITAVPSGVKAASTKEKPSSEAMARDELPSVATSRSSVLRP